MWLRCGLDVGRRWLGRVFGSGADGLAEVKEKWCPASGREILEVQGVPEAPGKSDNLCVTDRRGLLTERRGGEAHRRTHYTDQ